ncbi:MAG: MFS transporter [Hyphomicrobium sp.]|uniref:MFS transporter n=1 Tax=Hyphomicrobium sp. TaxID=82 RepID=UPI00132A3DE6|nr:MFS transporter [Hyphomicrobium sp.]KAB2939658.1 MAG: MFS transporter [Hyphomicrobium sp.]MBZ0208066.1 MFS transporter [Hyphomicrobium sp.]
MQENIALATTKARRRDWIGLAVIAIPCLIYSMDLTVLYLAVPQITADLKPSAAGLLWIVDIYGFMVAGALVTMGTLGDRVGRRKVLLIGAAAFGVTSVLAAYSTSAGMLIFARALQGLAAATLAPSTLSLIRNMFLDPRERALAIGIWVASFSAGAAIGPVFGGLILAHFWWGAVFLINVPVMLMLLVLGPLLLPEFRDPHAGHMDLVSAGQSIIAVLAVIYGIKRIAEDGLATLPVIAIVIGVIVAMVFFRRERRLADPLIDVRLFSAPAFGAALATNVLGLFMVLGAFLFITQYLQLVLGLGPLEAGLWMAPSGVVFALGSMAAPPLVRNFQPATVIATGLLLSAAGFASLTQIADAGSPWLLFGGMLAFCIGMSPIGAITTDLVLSAAPPERAGAASAISETSFELGGALGIAVFGSLFTFVYGRAMRATDLHALPVSAVESAKDGLGGAINAAQALTAEQGAQLLVAARAAFVYAFEVTSAVSAMCAVLAAMTAARLLRGAGTRG